MSHSIARIRDGVVVNIEVGEDDWLTQGANGDTLVVFTDEQPAYIGLTWTEQTGFEQPPSTPDPEPSTKPADTRAD